MCIRDSVRKSIEDKGVNFILGASVSEFNENKAILTNGETIESVSYTHLDVYKRQVLKRFKLFRLTYNRELCKLAVFTGRRTGFY